MFRNLLLSLAVAVLLLILLEKSFLWWYPRVFPVNTVITGMDEGLQPLLQSSKHSVMPEQYIALLGDSYAQGMGDWAKAAMTQPMAHYHSAGVLQELTGRDVVSFGSAGAGSVRALVTEPVSQLAYLRQYINADMPDPDIALVYFYEGNDLYDNAEYFRYSFPRLFDPALSRDEGTYRQYLQRFAVERDKTWRMVERNDSWRHWPFLRWVDGQLRQLLKLPARQEPADPAYDASLDPPWIFGGAAYREPGRINRAIIAGKEQPLPDFLQGPAINLNEQEWEDAWFAFEQALDFSRRQFPATRFVLVYIPSVINCYEVTSNEVSLQAYDRRSRLHSYAVIQERTAMMRKRFHQIADDRQLYLVDTTEALRDAAQKEGVHGPLDWNHFNRRGYTALAAAIAAHQPFLF